MPVLDAAAAKASTGADRLWPVYLDRNSLTAVVTSSKAPYPQVSESLRFLSQRTCSVWHAIRMLASQMVLQLDVWLIRFWRPSLIWAVSCPMRCICQTDWRLTTCLDITCTGLPMSVTCPLCLCCTWPTQPSNYQRSWPGCAVLCMCHAVLCCRCCPTLSTPRCRCRCPWPLQMVLLLLHLLVRLLLRRWSSGQGCTWHSSSHVSADVCCCFGPSCLVTVFCLVGCHVGDSLALLIF